MSIADNNAGKPYSRLTLADTLGRSPDSSSFREMITASAQYGLTVGSYAAPQLSLTDMGMTIAMPKDDAEVPPALQMAFLSNALFSKLAHHFDGNKIPQQNHFRNSLIRDFQVDPEWADHVARLFLENARYVGIVRTISGTERIDLSGASTQQQLQQPDLAGFVDEPADNPDQKTRLGEERQESGAPVPPTSTKPLTPVTNNQVFITHGHNSAVVSQLKDILQFGKFVPVVAEERETPSKPVPDKVMEDMRSCFAGVIHMEDERTLIDTDGNEHQMINQNVLIEIGAAMALYGRNFVLLVKKGVKLPSNLQGLYRCDYEGDKLDAEATMKLLRTFNLFETQQ